MPTNDSGDHLHAERAALLCALLLAGCPKPEEPAAPPPWIAEKTRAVAEREALLARARSASPREAIPALRELGARGTAGADDGDIVALLRERLGAEDPWLWCAAARGLGRLGAGSEEVVEALRACLGRRSSRTRLAAAAALVALGRLDAPTLRLALSAGDAELTARTLDVIGAPGRGGAVPDELAAELGELLEASDAALRLAAAEGLARLGPPARGATEQLERALGGDDAAFAAACAAALLAIDPDLVAHQRERLDLDAYGEPQKAALVLGHLGPAAHAAVPALVAALARDDWALREAIAAALARLAAAAGPGAAPEAFGLEPEAGGGGIATPEVRAALRALYESTTEARVLDDAAPALARLGGLPALEFALAAEDWRRRWPAAEALAEAGPAALPRLVALLAEDPHQSVRAAAAKALGRLGPAAAAAPPLAAAMRREEHDYVREAAIEAVAALGSAAAAAAVPALLAVTRGEDEKMRRGALAALACIAPEHPDAAGRLAESLRGGPRREREDVLAALPCLPRGALLLEAIAAAAASGEDAARAARALCGRPGPLDAAGAEALARLLAGPALRARALDALCRFGPAGRSALPAARPLLADEDPALRAAAACAIASWGPPEAGADGLTEEVLAVLGEALTDRGGQPSALAALARFGPEAAAPLRGALEEIVARPSQPHDRDDSIPAREAALALLEALGK